MSSGILAAISFAPESTWGTAVTPTKSIGVHPGDGLTVNRPAKFPTAIKGTLAKNNMGSYKGAATYDGSFELDYIPGYADYLLKSAIGTSSPTLVETGVYEHTYTEAEAKTSLTVEQAVGEVVNRFAGTSATGFKINASVDNPAVLTIPMVAKTVASQTAITPAYETDPVLTFLAATLSIAGTPMPEADNIEFEYQNGLTYKAALNGSIDPSLKYVKASTLTFSFEMYLAANAATQYAAYLNKTTQSIGLKLEGALIGATAKQTFDLSAVKATFTAASVAVNDDINLLKVSGECELDPATGKLFTLKTRNKLSVLT